MDNTNILKLENISIDYEMKSYNIRAVNNVSLPIKRGKITALVGESGSGKTTIVSAIIRCISEPGRLVKGTIKFAQNPNDADGEDIMEYEEKRLNQYRWGNVSMVFQAAQSALNPVMKIGEQFEETAYHHGVKVKDPSFVQQVQKLLHFVNLDHEKVLSAYPHELSGGMKQRVMIAFSLLLDPDIIILDEPTTALDVITQDYVFGILQDINNKLGITMILLTHDIGVVARMADYVGVMYAGQLMEYTDVMTVFKQRMHPYTDGLISATPLLSKDISSMRPIPGTPVNLLEIPNGCVFHPRCEKCFEHCTTTVPENNMLNDNHLIKCHLYTSTEKVGRNE